MECLIFGLITLIFLYKLDYHYFFTDEILYVQKGAEQIEGIFEEALQVPPLTKYIAGALFLLFKDNVFLLRLPFGLVGVITAYVLYMIVSREFNRKFGLLAAILFSTSKVIFDSTRMVMLESPMHLFWLLFLYFYYETFEKNHWKFYVFSGVFSGLSLSVKLSSIILVAFALCGFIYKLFFLKFDKRLLSKNYLAMIVSSTTLLLLIYAHMLIKTGVILALEQTAKAVKDVYINKSSEGKVHVVRGVVYEKSPWWTYIYQYYISNGLLRIVLYPCLIFIAMLRKNFYSFYWLTMFVITVCFSKFPVSRMLDIYHP